ncbi:hypothetical protein CRG98_031861 [Punica granatum]|uniref:Uncharacterized protein n=1 Tax=Punica granatum TaxID=22663 RepID=A0A2I0IUQ7_PUNGR|nr:hypothetical protein CRG98_031861 [Punica granatum]
MSSFPAKNSLQAEEKLRGSDSETCSCLWTCNLSPTGITYPWGHPRPRKCLGRKDRADPQKGTKLACRPLGGLHRPPPWL